MGKSQKQTANLRELALIPVFSVTQAERKHIPNKSLLKCDRAIQHSMIETKLKKLLKMPLNPLQTLTGRDPVIKHLQAESHR
jgi:hypothetical protein